MKYAALASVRSVTGASIALTAAASLSAQTTTPSVTYRKVGISGDSVVMRLKGEPRTFVSSSQAVHPAPG